MKKIFTTLFLASMMLSAHAALGLSIVTVDENEDETTLNITKDTTIVVTDYEEDFFSEEIVMSLNGSVSTSSKHLDVTISRSAAGLKDEFCLGQCYTGNGQLQQDLSLDLTNTVTGWFAHFNPVEAGTTTITYTFNDGVNPAIALTVKYNYLTSAVEDVLVPQHQGKIYNLLGQEMPAAELSELPKGIYIINGKKYIKQ